MGDTNDEVVDSWDEEQPFKDKICHKAPDKLRYPATGSIASALPPNLEELTFVFWNPVPGDEVSPLCCCSREYRCQSPDDYDEWAG